MKKVKQNGKSWKVIVKDLNAHKVAEFNFEVLFICNGHYVKPYLPKFANKFKRNWIHCKNYRNPNCFENHTVAIVGAAYSGMDILPQIAKIAKKVG